jgi:hypothetical protein
MVVPLFDKYCVYGVNCGCLFCALSYFDPTKCFMHDVMHTENEGVLNIYIRYFLCYAIINKEIKFDLESVNYDMSTLKSDREFTAHDIKWSNGSKEIIIFLL